MNKIGISVILLASLTSVSWGGIFEKSKDIFQEKSFDVDNELNKMKNKFKQKFSLSESQAKKVISRLQREMLKEDEKITVDIFFSDALPVMDINSIGASISARADITINPNTKKVTSIKLNGINSNMDKIANQLKKDDEILAIQDEYRQWARTQNIRIISHILKDDINPISFEGVIQQQIPYVTLTLSNKVLQKLLKKAGKSIVEIDIHTPLEVSGSNLTIETGDDPQVKSWKNRFKGYLTGTSVLQVQEQWTGLKNTKGQGVGIYYADATCPSEKSGHTMDAVVSDGYLQPQNGKYYFHTTTGEGGENIKVNKKHTMRVTGILSTVANEAELHCKSAEVIPVTNYLDANATYYDYVLPTSNEIKLINLETYSLNDFNNSLENRYFPMDRLFDEHIFNNRKIPVFISAGNTNADPSDDTTEGNFVLSPAKAFNVITVGNYQRDGIDKQSMYPYSRYGNPKVGNNTYQKPEISAPGVDYLHSGTQGAVPLPVYALDSGTSYSTPFAAAIAADLMSYNTMYKDSAALLKAAMIAGATDKISSAYTKGGEGGVDMLTTSWALTYGAWYYDGNPRRPFTDNVNGRECFSLWNVNLETNREARFVISWLNKPFNANIVRIPNSYTMEVLKDGKPVYFVPSGSSYPRNIADKPNQGYQVINLDNSSGLHTVRVCRSNNHDNNRFDIGFALSQRPKNFSSWNQ